MTDPLAEVVTLLQPVARLSKRVGAAGAWRVRRSEFGQPFYCAMLHGVACLTVDGHAPLALEAGDFVLIPAAHGFTMSSVDAPSAEQGTLDPVALPGGEFRLGTADGEPDVRMLVGHCSFDSPDAALLVSLLPQRVHVRGEPRLATLVQLVGEESRHARPAREVVLARLLEVLLIEALRSRAGTATDAPPGLLRGLADSRLAAAIRRMHEAPARAWTVPQLANEAALSRSAFFDRFRQAVGVAPMEYLLAWRMVLAKDLLRRQQASVTAIAERVGYSSASTFSAAFSRYVGMSPSRYAREHDHPLDLPR
jgi:AraC-like DNA-binding protein